MKKKPKIHYHPHGGSAPMGLYWSEGPYGLAQEAVDGEGVVFLAPNGELLGVIFDDVAEENDDQHLVTPHGDKISLKVRKRNAQVSLSKTRQRA